VNVTVGVDEPPTVATALNWFGNIPEHTALPLAVKPGYTVNSSELAPVFCAKA